MGAPQPTVVGAFFLAIGVAIAAIVCQQINRGQSYFQGGNGPVNRREYGRAFWLYIAIDTLAALICAAIGIGAILGHLPPP